MRRLWDHAPLAGFVILASLLHASTSKAIAKRGVLDLNTEWTEALKKIEELVDAFNAHQTPANSVSNATTVFEKANEALLDVIFSASSNIHLLFDDTVFPKQVGDASKTPGFALLRTLYCSIVLPMLHIHWDWFSNQ